MWIGKSAVYLSQGQSFNSLVCQSDVEGSIFGAEKAVLYGNVYLDRHRNQLPYTHPLSLLVEMHQKRRFMPSNVS